MIPARYDFQAHSNADFVEVLYPQESGVAFDMIGLSAKIDIRRHADDNNVILKPTVVIDTVERTITVSVSRESLEYVYSQNNKTGIFADFIDFVYDLKITYPDRIEEIWTQGIFRIIGGVTKNV